MAKNNLSPSSDSAGVEFAEIEKLLRYYAGDVIVSASRGFMERCRQTAERASVTRSLTASSSRMDFEPVSLAQHLRRVAQAAGMAWDRVIAVLGISSQNVEVDLASPTDRIIRLAVALGISRRNLVLHFRIAQLAYAGVPVSRFRSPTPVGDPACLLEAQLDQFDQSLGREWEEKSLRLQQQVTALYDACTSSNR